MFVIAEVIHGNVYALDDTGAVWRIWRSTPVDGPMMECLTNEVGRETIKRLAEPRLIRWLKD
jgi:hypothetical protein